MTDRGDQADRMRRGVSYGAMQRRREAGGLNRQTRECLHRVVDDLRHQLDDCDDAVGEEPASTRERVDRIEPVVRAMLRATRR